MPAVFLCSQRKVVSGNLGKIISFCTGNGGKINYWRISLAEDESGIFNGVNKVSEQNDS